MTSDHVIELVRQYWNCVGIKDAVGREIGKHVPGFVKVKEKQFADVWIRFENCKFDDEEYWWGEPQNYYLRPYQINY